jgi:hypothetical protein
MLTVKTACRICAGFRKFKPDIENDRIINARPEPVA